MIESKTLTNEFQRYFEKVSTANKVIVTEGSRHDPLAYPEITVTFIFNMEPTAKLNKYLFDNLEKYAGDVKATMDSVRVDVDAINAIRALKGYLK